MTEQAAYSPALLARAELFAKRNHGAFQIYQQWLNEKVSPNWEDMSDEWRRHNILAVAEVLDKPLDIKDIGEQHRKWVVSLTEQGYVRGEVKDHDKKTHPSLVDFEELPFPEQAKDFLFLSLTKLQNQAYFQGISDQTAERPPQD